MPIHPDLLANMASDIAKAFDLVGQSNDQSLISDISRLLGESIVLANDFDWLSKNRPLTSPDGEIAIVGQVNNQKLTKLKEMSPWRKGPFKINDTVIDSEWQSQKKWRRLESSGISFQGKRVLDVGCNNGYYMFQASLAGAHTVVGIDPYVHYFHQFYSLNSFFNFQNIYFLPMKFQSFLPSKWRPNLIMMMGVLYHLRDPISGITWCRDLLPPGGELILETLIIPGEETVCLVPQDRYAQMKNVYFLPTATSLINWIKRFGFDSIKIIHESVTSIDEQRNTDWVNRHSLINFLDPINTEKTVEGYPRPRRIIVHARRRGA